MSDEPTKDDLRRVRALAAKVRQDPAARVAVRAVLATEGVASIFDLASAKLSLALDLCTAFEEMDADVAAMDQWADDWRPANLDLSGLD